MPRLFLCLLLPFALSVGAVPLHRQLWGDFDLDQAGDIIEDLGDLLVEGGSTTVFTIATIDCSTCARKTTEQCQQIEVEKVDVFYTQLFGFEEGDCISEGYTFDDGIYTWYDYFLGDLEIQQYVRADSDLKANRGDDDDDWLAGLVKDVVQGERFEMTISQIAEELQDWRDIFSLDDQIGVSILDWNIFEGPTSPDAWWSRVQEVICDEVDEVAPAPAPAPLVVSSENIPSDKPNCNDDIKEKNGLVEQFGYGNCGEIVSLIEMLQVERGYDLSCSNTVAEVLKVFEAEVPRVANAFTVSNICPCSCNTLASAPAPVVDYAPVADSTSMSVWMGSDTFGFLGNPCI